MVAVFCLNPDYSTTRLATHTAPVACNPPDAKFESMLFLSPHPQRKGEGGLRKQGYFKPGGCPEPGGAEAKSRPLITVITVVFNGAMTLEQTILSVINQSYDNVEYIIVDGSSTDGTIDIIRKYEHAIDYWMSEPDAGIYDAWNKGVRLSTGDWISFLGAGDIYQDDAIQSYVDFIRNVQRYPLEYVSSRVNLVSSERILQTIGLPWNWKDFRRYMNVAHVGSLHHRQLFERVGLYDTTYKICGDYELLLRPRDDLHAAFLNKVTANMASDGVSNRNPQVFEETLKAKVRTGRRGRIPSQIEKILAILRWKVRYILWRP